MPPTVPQIVTHFNPSVRRDLLRRGFKVQNRAKQLLSGTSGHPKRVDTGNLRSSIHTQPTTWSGGPAVRVGTNVKYARYVHYGTGLYGPRRRLIRPRTAKVLRFQSKRGTRRGRYVYTPYVRGMRPNAFLKDALPAFRP